jgi:TPR repeat protein
MECKNIYFSLAIAMVFLVSGCATRPENPSPEALKILTQAEQGDAEAQFTIGRYYYGGWDGVREDTKKAAEFYQRAAAQGHPGAKEELAFLYFRGKGVNKDHAKAASLWLEAAEDKYLEGIHCSSLSELYRYGDGVSKDPEQAYKWYQRCKDTGYMFCHEKEGSRLQKVYGFDPYKYSVIGLFIDGWKYERGDGVEQDIAKALALYREAARKKEGRAQERLGYLYMAGEGVPKDYAEAAKWYKMAIMEFGDTLYSQFCRAESTKDYDLAEDYILTPSIEKMTIMGTLLSEAETPGQYISHPEGVYRTSEARMRQVLAFLPKDYFNIQRCIRMAGIPKSCAGEILQIRGRPMLGDVDCVACTPAPDIDYIPGLKMDSGTRPYR